MVRTLIGDTREAIVVYFSSEALEKKGKVSETACLS
jgi:hypothetical protein